MADLTEHRVAALAAELHRETGEGTTALAIVQRTRELIGSADHVSITLRRKRHSYRTLASTSELADTLDGLQYTLKEGPCVQATEENAWTRSGELQHDSRWQTWGPRAHDLSARSALSVCLVSRLETIGALNMYSTTARQFQDPAEIDAAVLWASHAANAIAHVQRVEGLESAVTSRHIIGVAQGILMERFDLDLDRAFSLLARLSSTRNEKVRDVAAEIARTGQLPE